MVKLFIFILSVIIASILYLVGFNYFNTFFGGWILGLLSVFLQFIILSFNE